MNATYNRAQLLDIIRAAIVWVKHDAVSLDPAELAETTSLAEPPIYLDSLEFISMVTRLEESFGLIADDEVFAVRSIRTIGDVVNATQDWLGGSESDERA